MSDYDSIEGLQQQGIIDSKRVATIKICLVMFFHSCISAVLMSQIFAIWLDKQAHLTPLQIGEIMGLKAVVAIFYKPLFGWLLDKTQLRIRFVITLGIAGLAAGPFFQFVYKPLLLSGSHTAFYAAGLLGGVYFGYVVIAGGAAMFGYCGRYIEAHGGPLDKIGASSFMGWLIMGFAMTMMYTYNPTYSFYLSSFAAFCFIITLFCLKVKPFDKLNTKTTSSEKIKIADLKLLIFNPRFYVLAFFSTTIIVAVYAQYSQVGRYNLYFWPKTMQSFGLKFDAYLNVPLNVIIFLLLANTTAVIKRINANRAVLFLSFSYGVSLILLGLAALFPAATPSHYLPGLIASHVAFQLLSFTNPFTMLIILSYVNVSFDKKVSGTAFLVGFHFICNLCGSVGNAVVGGMFEKMGWATTYLILGVFIFICIVILYLLIRFANSHDKIRVLTHLERLKQRQQAQI